MNTIFLGFVNRAVTAGWLVLAVLVLRLILRKAPRSVHCLLWGAVAVRLLLPFSIESPASLVPTTQTVVPASIYSTHPVIQTGIPAVNAQITDQVQRVYSAGSAPSAGAAVRVTDTLSILWLAGLAVLLLYCLGTYLHMRSQLRTAVHLRDNLWQSEWVDSPFVLGLFAPRIYLPFRLDEETLTQVEAHERSHIARGDHVWKVLAFLLLAAHWFHPLLWVAYFLFCRDLEYACDERVIGGLDATGRKRYSEALLRCAAPRRTVAPCPVAFGETGVGGRIKNVLRYRKPAFWVAVLAATALLVAAVCFLTDPPVKSGEQWLRTRRPGNLSDVSLVSDSGGVTVYNLSLSDAQRKALAPLLSGLTPEQLVPGGSSPWNPEGFSLFFPKPGVFLAPTNGNEPGDVLLKFSDNKITYIQSPELAEWLAKVLPGESLVWRCPYVDGQPAAALTVEPQLICDELRIQHMMGSFAGGTPAVCVREEGGIHSYNCGEVRIPAGRSDTWTPPIWNADDPDFPPSDNFSLTWKNGDTMNATRSADLRVHAVPVEEDGLTAVDYHFTAITSSVPLELTLEGDTLTLSTPYPVVDGFTYNDFYGAVYHDIDGDGAAEYCTLGMGPTSGLFTFTLAAQTEDSAVKYARIFHTDWYKLSFAYRSGKLVVKGVTQDGEEHFFDISVRDGSLILSEGKTELPTWGDFTPKN